MKRILTLGTMALAAAMLAGCAEPGHEKEQTGTVVGAVVGGLIGSQIGSGSGATAAAIAGTIIGGAVGKHVGRSMDDTDRMKTAQAFESAPSGTPTTWRNPNTGVQYTVVPQPTYQTAQGPCRDYTMDSVIDGKPEKLRGTACRQPDGSWRVANN